MNVQDSFKKARNCIAQGIGQEHHRGFICFGEGVIRQPLLKKKIAPK